MEYKTLQEANIAIYNNLCYRSGTKFVIDNPQMAYYNHATGYIAFTNAEGITLLEGGGIYTLESKESDLLKKSSIQKGPNLLVIYLMQERVDRSSSSFFKFGSKEKRKSDAGSPFKKNASKEELVT